MNQQIKEFFHLQGLHYWKSPIIEAPSLLEHSPRESAYYGENKKVFDDLVRRYEGSALQGFVAPLEIRSVPEAGGFGLFAAEDLPGGLFLGEYTGEVRQADLVDGSLLDQGGYSTDYAWEYPAEDDQGHLFEIDALRGGNELRFANHSFQPNCQVDHFPLEHRWVVFFFTLCPVPRGTQILVDYGEEYWAGGQRELVLL